MRCVGKFSGNNRSVYHTGTCRRTSSDESAGIQKWGAHEQHRGAYSAYTERDVVVNCTRETVKRLKNLLQSHHGNYVSRSYLVHFLVILLLDLPSRWSAMKILTGGKSNLDVIEGEEARAFDGTIGSTRPTSKSPTSRRHIGGRSAGFNDLDAASVRDRTNRIGGEQDANSIRPTRFSAMLARLLASLSSNPARNFRYGLTANAGNHMGLDGDITNRRRKRQLDLFDDLLAANTTECLPVEPPACQDVPFDAVVPQHDGLLAFKNGRIHAIAMNGSVTTTEPLNYEDVFPSLPDNVTGALKMRDFIYVFLGSTYLKYRPHETVRRSLRVIPTPVPVSTGFHGVPSPIHGSFQLNSHTYVLITGPTFVFYQPDAEPPVNPKFSPNLLTSIIGGPKNVTQAFNMPDGRRFLASLDLLYELNDRMQVIKVQSLKKRLDGTGWLDCEPVVPVGCEEKLLAAENASLPVPVEMQAIQPTEITAATAAPVPIIHSGQLRNDTIKFASGTSIVGSPQAVPLGQPLEAGTAPDSAAISTGSRLFELGQLDKQSVIPTTAGLLQDKPRGEIHHVPSILHSVITGTKNADDSARPKVARPAIPLPPQHPTWSSSPSREFQDKFDDLAVAEKAPNKPDKMIREEVINQPGSRLAKQLEAQGVVLRGLMENLSNLTQALSSLAMAQVSPVADMG